MKVETNVPATAKATMVPDQRTTRRTRQSVRHYCLRQTETRRPRELKIKSKNCKKKSGAIHERCRTDVPEELLRAKRVPSFEDDGREKQEEEKLGIEANKTKKKKGAGKSVCVGGMRA
jgi:hypothetical protein